MRKQTTMDNRGQISAGRAVTLVVALAVFGIIASVLAPVGLDALTQDNDVSFTGINEGETNEVISGSLNVTLDNSEGADTNISVTLTDVDSGNTLALTNISQGSSQNGTLEGETLTVTADDVIDATTADFTVSHPPDYAWGSGAKALWGILDLIIVLVIFLFAVGWAVMAQRNAA